MAICGRAVYSRWIPTIPPSGTRWTGAGSARQSISAEMWFFPLPRALPHDSASGRVDRSHSGRNERRAMSQRQRRKRRASNHQNTTMPMRALLFEVRLFGGRYHGVGDWPPSPFRLFQALVSGAYGDRWVAEPREGKDAAFHWLERLDPPSMLAPPFFYGRAVRIFVPNNDLDAKGGDPRRVAEVRAEKQTKPLIFSAEIPFVYAWAFEEAESAHARLLCELSERLHTLGRGIDAAFARGRLADWDVSVEQLRNAGRLSIPAGVAEGKPGLRCPAPG